MDIKQAEFIPFMELARLSRFAAETIYNQHWDRAGAAGGVFLQRSDEISGSVTERHDALVARVQELEGAVAAAREKHEAAIAAGAASLAARRELTRLEGELGDARADLQIIERHARAEREAAWKRQPGGDSCLKGGAKVDSWCEVFGSHRIAVHVLLDQSAWLVAACQRVEAETTSQHSRDTLAVATWTCRLPLTARYFPRQAQ